MDYNKLKNTAKEILKKHPGFDPKTAIVLGSGLGSLSEEINVRGQIFYNEIEGMPVSTVDGHKGRFIFGNFMGVPLIIMDGRVHMYEGYEAATAALPIRMLYLFGVENIILTNASGGITYDSGTIMLVEDHISSFVSSPLVGPNDEMIGPRFPDMSNVYNKELSSLLCESAAATGVAIKKGIYCQLTGPNYETPAEVRMLKVLGADAVGMSTAIEAQLAVHCGMKVCALSCITNKAAGLGNPLSHEEVKIMGARMSGDLKRLLRDFIRKIGESYEDTIL